MNGPLRRLSVVVALLLGSLLLSTTWVQFVNAGEISAGQGNVREVYREFGRERGPIVVGGDPVAVSTEVGGDYRFLREYPAGPLYAHATGYYSIVYGTSGIERTNNDVLAGTADALFYSRIGQILTGEDPSGGSVQLTLDPAVQQAAAEALGDQRGAVIALEPATGRVLAMVSSPSYDPDRLSSHDLGDVREAWEELNADEGRPLENRALSGRLYPPGSVFKIVTAAAALESGDYTPETELPGGAELDLPLTDATLPNYGRRPCEADGTTTLADAMRTSCNPAFGQIGIDLGAEAIREQAAEIGYLADLDIPLPVTPATVPGDLNAPQSAQAAIGQFDVRVAPIHIAMTSAAVANDGLVMTPQLVRSIRGPDLQVVEDIQPEPLSTAFSPETAAALTDMMVSVVEDGTGTAAQIPGVQVAGKTGTAQTGNDTDPHAWFTSFAPADDPQVAVAVVVENGGDLGSETSGGRVAAPVARAVMEAVLAR
ncbi:peptidoglycan D,D-transpeptidase FtsI family protein [Aquipuribacter nitratireducens]|uniref:Peptidoglycan D,D-transpeptidase FtsI family protein n=1 Tax=Aquipuribacter nitratireducens TaxID=650104 RepID=A0ABW0GMP9_9MICO